MAFDDYVSESEAASLAGVSVLTLRRFVEAGYLRGEQDPDGVRLFPKREVASLFGVSVEALQSRTSTAPRASSLGTSPTSPRTSAPRDGSNRDEYEPSLHQRIEPTVQFATTPNQASGSAPASEDEQQAEETNSTTHYSAEVLEASTPERHEDAHEDDVLETQPERSEPRAASDAMQTKASDPTPSSSATDVTRLQHIVELQERILALREAELLSVKQERDWLRTRIERLEDKQDRDQLLLLTETQMIKRLVAKQEPRRSPVRAALEWLGFAEPSSQIDHTPLKRE